MAARRPAEHLTTALAGEAEHLVTDLHRDEQIVAAWIRQQHGRTTEKLTGAVLIVGGLYLFVRGRRMRKAGKRLFRGM